MLDGPLPIGFARSVVVIDPGEHLLCEQDWNDAIVSIDSGELVLRHPDQVAYRFGPGALLCLDGRQPLDIYNPGPAPAVLILVWRD